MNYLIITDVYLPLRRLITEEIEILSKYLSKEKNKNVTIATYHQMPNSLKDANLNKEHNRSHIKIIRAGIKDIKKFSFLVRAISECINPIILIFKIIFSKIPHDKIIVFSPSILLAFFAILYGRLFSKKIILNVQDIWPQNIIEMGLITNKIIIAILKIIENFNYKYSHKIIVNTYESQNYLIHKKKLAKEKVNVIYPWNNNFKLNFDKKRDKRSFGLQYNLNLSNNDFLIIFTGTLGNAQNLNIVIDISKKLQNQNIKFLFVGEGPKKNQIQKLANESKIQNLFFLQPIIGDEFYNLLSLADLGLATLDIKNTTGPIPGKIITYMSHGLATLALVDDNHLDLNKIFNETGCGFIINPNKGADYISSEILKISKNIEDLNSMGNKSLDFAINNFSSTKLLPKYIDIIEE